MEPWFLVGGAGGPGAADFDSWRAEAEAAGVRFWASIGELPKPESPRVVLIVR